MKLQLVLATLAAVFGLLIAAPTTGGAQAGGTIEGTVTGNGVGVDGVLIDYWDETRSTWLGTVSTDANGDYTVSGLAPDCYTLTFIAPAGETWAATGTQWYDVFDVCPTAGGTEVRDAQLTSTMGTISGTVTDSGAGVGNVAIDYWNDDRTLWLGTVYTDANGDYTTPALAPVCYIITFIAPTGETWEATGTQWYNQSACVTAGQTQTRNAQLAAAAADAISGRVTQDGIGIEGVAIDRWNADRSVWLSTAYTDADGTYAIADLDPGCYTITFIAPDGGSWEATGTQWYNRSALCTADPGSLNPVDAALNSTGEGWVYGTADPVPATGSLPSWLADEDPRRPTPTPEADAIEIDCANGDSPSDLAGLNPTTGTDVVLNGACQGQLLIDWSGTAADPVVVTSLNPGPATRASITATSQQANYGGIIEVAGDHVQVWDIEVFGTDTELTACGGGQVVTSYVNGVRVNGNNNTIARMDISNAYSGVFLQSGAGNMVIRSYIHDMDVMQIRSGGDDDAGAIGVEVWAQDSDVSWNYFRNNRACSPDYVTDGSSVEIYGGVGTDVHHNLSVNDHHFTELGGQAADSTFEHNRYISTFNGSSPARGERFMVSHGPGSPVHGPVVDTTARSNKITLTGSFSAGFICAGCDSSSLDLGGNIITVSADEVESGVFTVVPADQPDLPPLP